MRAKRANKEIVINGLIGGNIRFVRKAREIRLRELSERIGCLSTANLSDIESGETSCSAYKLSLIARELGVKIDDLMGYDIEKNYPGFYGR